MVKWVFPKVAFDNRGVEIQEPAIFVSNHADAFGPLALFFYFPVKLYPWVMFNLMDRQTCARFLKENYFISVLHLPRPIATWISHLIADLCVSLFRQIGTIPVYHNSRRIIETISRSIFYIEEGRSLLIFPEVPDAYLNRYINRFNTGFIEIAKKVGKDGHRTINIYPVSVNRARRLISLGQPSVYDITKSYPEERKRLEAELEAKVEGLLAENR